VLPEKSPVLPDKEGEFVVEPTESQAPAEPDAESTGAATATQLLELLESVAAELGEDADAGAGDAGAGVVSGPSPTAQGNQAIHAARSSIARLSPREWARRSGSQTGSSSPSSDLASDTRRQGCIEDEPGSPSIGASSRRPGRPVVNPRATLSRPTATRDTTSTSRPAPDRPRLCLLSVGGRRARR
jgi:hypothetical protein